MSVAVGIVCDELGCTCQGSSAHWTHTRHDATCLASIEIGGSAIVVHAKDEEAKQFYLRHADLLPLPGEPLHLMLPTKMIGQMLGN